MKDKDIINSFFYYLVVILLVVIVVLIFVNKRRKVGEYDRAEGGSKMMMKTLKNQIAEVDPNALYK